MASLSAETWRSTTRVPACAARAMWCAYLRAFTVGSASKCDWTLREQMGALASARYISLTGEAALEAEAEEEEKKTDVKREGLPVASATRGSRRARSRELVFSARNISI